MCPQMIDLTNQRLIFLSNRGIKIKINHWPIKNRSIDRDSRTKIHDDVRVSKRVDPGAYLRLILEAGGGAGSGQACFLHDHPGRKFCKQRGQFVIVMDRMRPNYQLNITEFAAADHFGNAYRSRNLEQKVRRSQCINNYRLVGTQSLDRAKILARLTEARLRKNIELKGAHNVDRRISRRGIELVKLSLS